MKSRFRFRRAAFPVASALVIFLVVLGTGWEVFTDSYYIVPFVIIEHDLDGILSLAEDVREKSGKYPADREQLLAAARKMGLVEPETSGNIFKDPIGGLYVYELVGGKPRVHYVPRPRAEGGASPHHRITRPGGSRRPALAPLREYIDSELFRRCLWIGAICGCLTGLLWLACRRRAGSERRPLRASDVVKALLFLATSALAVYLVLFIHLVKHH